MKRIKILFIAEELELNGAMTSLLSLLKALPTERYNLSLFLFKHGGEMMNEIPCSITILPELLQYCIHRAPRKEGYRKSLKNRRLDLLFYRFAIAIQRSRGWNYNFWKLLPHIEGRYDVAICYNDGFVAPMMLRKVEAEKKCAWIHLQYSICPQKQYIYDALKKMDLCVAVSHDTGEDIKHVLGDDIAIHTIHNITDIKNCQNRALKACEASKKEGVWRIVSVGRVTEAKYFDIIPPVANILKLKGIKFEWFILGNGDKLNELIKETKLQGLDDCVHFIGARSNPMPWIKSADVFVNPSRFEAWGMTVSEALCLGKAVIVSDIPVFKEQITDGVNGIICHITPANLANDIERILTDNNLRHKLECNALSYPFTKESVVKEFDELIEKLCLPKE